MCFSPDDGSQVWWHWWCSARTVIWDEVQIRMGRRRGRNKPVRSSGGTVQVRIGFGVEGENARLVV